MATAKTGLGNFDVASLRCPHTSFNGKAKSRIHRVVTFDSPPNENVISWGHY